MTVVADDKFSRALVKTDQIKCERGETDRIQM